MTTKRNALSRELIHAEGWKDSARKYAQEMQRWAYPFSADENRKANKYESNRKWYELHKAWKKKYNADYYQKNKEYWRNRYESLLDRSRHKITRSYELDTYEPETYKDARRTITDDEYYWAKKGAGVADLVRDSHQQLYDLELARLNYKKAEQDYQWYMDNHKKMKVTEAWSDGAKMIRDAGKSFLSKFGLKL